MTTSAKVTNQLGDNAPTAETAPLTSSKNRNHLEPPHCVKSRPGDATGLIIPATATLESTSETAARVVHPLPMSSAATRSLGISGPIGPRPGVYRPCARCRVKKTKCDRLKPACSSCVKAGSDVMCVYDNDEPSLDADNDVVSTEPISDIARTDSAARIDSEHSSRKEASSKFKKLESSDNAAGMTSRGTNGHATRSSGAGDNGSTGDNGSNGAHSSTSHDNSTQRAPTSFGNRDDRTGVPLSKKTKIGSGSGSSQMNKPSTLRRTGVSISEVTKEREHAADETVDIMSVDDAEDKLVSGLTVKESAMDDASFETSKRISTYPPEDTSSHTTAAPANSNVGGGIISRPKKQIKTTPTAGVAQSRIMVDLPTTKPPPVFVIDKTQRARKWGRSRIMVQTLGGEVSVPMWTSDQQMLLNEPRPYFVQRSFPHLTNPAASSSSSSSSTAINLARMAVLNQRDSKPGCDTPERGSTPDSGESTPIQPSSPRMATMKKKKRGFRKHMHDVADRSTGAVHHHQDISVAPTQKRKRMTVSSSLVTSDDILGPAAGDEDGQGELSSTRSTPAPTSRSSSALPTKNSMNHKPRAIPTRPRMYPCSFEGCTKSFMDKFHLKRHETRHVTQVIVCGVDGCTKAYDSLSTMRRHQSMMHKQWKEEMAAAGVDVGIRKAWQQKQDAERNKSSRLSENEDGEEDNGPGEGEGAAEEDGPIESPGSSPGPSALTFDEMLRYHD
ncbi:hypothetical protein KVV02_003554 [Mortierella alpina]|uniref:Zn(2)-C6 fungal-type domain-containing protein n=1 Tax=Mortierella alpina TaxID=64518 RepID=A0A9P8AA68_MORAP|nr:hypothetical protein KVV02_003554 [Mortierella alpina]